MKNLLIIAGPKKDSYGSGNGKSGSPMMPEEGDDDAEQEGGDAEDFKAVFSSFCKAAGLSPENPEKSARAFKTAVQMVCHSMMD